MTEPIKVATVGEIADEEALVVPRSTSGWTDDIAVFYSNGEYRALDDTCTHENASLAEGWIEGDEVECPIHSAKFSLCTGAALCLPASLPARTHRVEVRGDDIWLHVGVPVADAAAADGTP
jgi:3-phenylpropionate/trans-cinnamate dioxygenase ferredoxin subunit